MGKAYLQLWLTVQVGACYCNKCWMREKIMNANLCTLPTIYHYQQLQFIKKVDGEFVRSIVSEAGEPSQNKSGEKDNVGVAHI